MSGITNTGCRDCGDVYLHWHPLSPYGKDLIKKFDNVHCAIYYDRISHHFLHYLHGATEKVFFSCEQTLEQLTDNKEIGKILAWAEIEDD